MIHDSMPYASIQGQGHRSPKVAKMADFKVYLLPRYAYNQTTNGILLYSYTMSNFCRDRFLIFVLIGVT